LAVFTAFFESLWSPSTNPDGSTVQKAGMSYVYDEDGTLVAQTLTGGAQTSWGQSARYIYLPTASGPMPVAAIYGTKHYAIQSDHLNTPRRLIQSDGQVAWQWAYSAFGDEQPTIAKNRFANLALNQSFGSTTVAAVTFNLRYPGQYFDQESSLHYNGHRSYCANCGRYTQSDPIDLQGGWNRFSYVGQNPLSFTDPTGLVWIYQQSTGNLYFQPTNPSSATLVGTGYAGGGAGLNNSALDLARNTGPLPQGTYTIGPQQTITTGNGTVLPRAMRLIPDADNWMYGRDGFIIHGGNMVTQTSSQGCIIQKPEIRNQIGSSGDRKLRVVP
jgi:RHS repeat-associated protein